MRLRLLLLLSLVGSAACAPALSTFQPAHVPNAGHVQAELGTDISIPTGTIGDVVDAAIDLEEATRGRELTNEEEVALFDAGASLGVHAPSPVPHIGIAFAPLNQFEVGLRYSGSALRLGVRGQFLKEKEHGVDMSVGLGASYFSYSFPVGNVLYVLEFEDFKRLQFDLPILFGKKRDWYRLWGGPKAMFTTFGTELVLNLPEIQGVREPKRELASFDGTAFYLGAQGGAAVGYKHVFFGFELSMAYMAASWDMVVLDEPVRSKKVNSLIVAPGFALMAEF
jgi:hypothetical protein